MAADTPTHKLQSVPLDLIDSSPVRRGLNCEELPDLIESIRQNGLLNPISVRENGDGSGRYTLIAGRHRLEAVERLGIPEISAAVYGPMSRDRARLIELSENLHRAELTKLERSDYTAEYIELTEKLFQPETVSSGGRGNEGGIRRAARELGIDSTAAHRAVKIAGLTSEAKAAATEAGLDNNQSALLETAKLAPEHQAKALTERRKPAKQKHQGPYTAVIIRATNASHGARGSDMLIPEIVSRTKPCAEDWRKMVEMIRGAADDWTELAKKVEAMTPSATTRTNKILPRARRPPSTRSPSEIIKATEG
jgi:ParB family chromosome partitioning protein